MIRRRIWLALLVFAPTVGRPASASSITYKAEEVVLEGLPISYQPGIALPSLTQGGTVALGEIGYENSQLAAGPSVSMPIGGTLGFLIQGYDSSGNAVSPLISVDGQYQGTFYSGGLPARESSSFAGVVTSLTPLSDDPVPAALQDLVDNPGRMSIESVVSIGGSGDTLESVILTIAPQAVPEPSTIFTTVSAFGMAWVIRKGVRRT